MTIELQSVLRWSTVGTLLVRFLRLPAISVLVVALAWTSAQAFASGPLDAPGRYLISQPAKPNNHGGQKRSRERASAQASSSSNQPLANAPLSPPPPSQSPPTLIDINNASARELVQLPGIGPAKAQRILRFRNRRGRFRRIRDLRRVKGIGRKTLAKLRSRITLGTSESVNSK